MLANFKEFSWQNEDTNYWGISRGPKGRQGIQKLEIAYDPYNPRDCSYYRDAFASHKDL